VVALSGRIWTRRERGNRFEKRRAPELVQDSKVQKKKRIAPVGGQAVRKKPRKKVTGRPHSFQRRGGTPVLKNASPGHLGEENKGPGETGRRLVLWGGGGREKEKWVGHLAAITTVGKETRRTQVR